MNNVIKPVTEEQRMAREELRKQAEEVVGLIRQFAKFNSFLSSLIGRVDKNWELTPAQVESAKNVIDRITLRKLEAQQEVSGPAPRPNSKFKVGDILTVNQTVAMKIGIQAGFNKKFHNIEILEVVNEDYGSITVKAVTCYKKVSHCGVCGLTLTDPESIARGIGPVCGRRTGAKNVEDLDRALGKAEIMIRIPKYAIKSHFSV